MSVNIVDAWSQWLTGKQVAEFELLGLSILCWGRLGKLLQFIAALSILAEILGPDRIRKFGASLHATLTVEGTRGMIRDAIRWRSRMLGHMRNGSDRETLRNLVAMPTDRFNYFVALILGIVIAVGVNNVFGWTESQVILTVIVGWTALLVITVLAALILLATLSPFVTIALIATFSWAGMVFDMLILEPIAWVLDRDHLDRWVKLASLVVLLIGFHFDLLAS
jgi:hypothetical protein